MTDPKFIMFGSQHGLTLLAILLAAILLPLLVRPARTTRHATLIAVFLGAAILGFKGWETALHVSRGTPWHELLPFHLCDAAALVSGIMLLTRNRFLFELNYFWGLGGTVQALLTPDLQTGFPSTGYWLFFISHGLVLVGVGYALIIFRMRPQPKSILRVFLATAAMSLAAVAANALWGTNYMYMAQKPEAASLLDFFGPWPWYVLAGYPLVLAFLFLLYSPFWIHDRVKNRPS